MVARCWGVCTRVQPESTVQVPWAIPNLPHIELLEPTIAAKPLTSQSLKVDLPREQRIQSLVYEKDYASSRAVIKRAAETFLSKLR